MTPQAARHSQRAAARSAWGPRERTDVPVLQDNPAVVIQRASGCGEIKQPASAAASQPHSLATENHHSSVSRGTSPTYWSAKDWHTDTVFEPSSTKFPCSHERNLRDYGMRRARWHHRATYLVKIAPKAEQQLQVRVLTLARRRPHGIILCALYQRRVRRATRRTVRRWRGTLPVLMTVSWPATQHASWLYL